MGCVIEARYHSQHCCSTDVLSEVKPANFDVVLCPWSKIVLMMSSKCLVRPTRSKVGVWYACGLHDRPCYKNVTAAVVRLYGTKLYVVAALAVGGVATRRTWRNGLFYCRVAKELRYLLRYSNGFHTWICREVLTEYTSTLIKKIELNNRNKNGKMMTLIVSSK